MYPPSASVVKAKTVSEVRVHPGIRQRKSKTGPAGSLKPGYKYSGKKGMDGKPIIVKVRS